MNLLIIEDNKEILYSLKESFENHEFIVECAEDGMSGIYKATTNNYDLLVVDIGLPKKNGKEVCIELRKAGRNMPIIMLSVQGNVHTKAELLAAGADDYVTKPFSFIELLARINACLRRPREITQETYSIATITLNSTSRCVTAGKKCIHLTPKEFFVLEYLMRHRGFVLSQQNILDNIWGSETDPFTNTVETHIANIRRKLRGRVKKDFIKTISNGGYKIS